MTPETQALTAEIVALRDAHWSWGEIAKRVGRSTTYCHELHDRAITVEQSGTTAETARMEECRLLEQVIRRSLRDIEADEAKESGGSLRSRAESWRVVLAASDQRAKLLGLNPPQRREITVFSEDAIDAEIKRLEAQLGELPPAASREVKGS